MLDELTIYLNQINQFELLTAEQEAELCKVCRRRFYGKRTANQ